MEPHVKVPIRLTDREYIRLYTGPDDDGSVRTAINADEQWSEKKSNNSNNNNVLL